MIYLFHAYWWLIFPIWGIAMATWHTVARYRRQKGVLDVIKTYAERGETPPEALLAALTANDDDDGGRGGRRSPAHYWSLAGLFAVLAVGFGFGAWSSGFEGVGWPFGVVSLVMAATATWALINALVFGRQKKT